MPLTGYRPSRSGKDSNCKIGKQANARFWRILIFTCIVVVILSVELVANGDAIAYSFRTGITLIGVLIFLNQLSKT